MARPAAAFDCADRQSLDDMPLREDADHRGGTRLRGGDCVDRRSALRRTPGGLEGQPGARIRGTEDVPPAEPDERRLGRLQGEGEHEPVDRDVADAPEDAGDPVPEVTEHLRERLRLQRRRKTGAQSLQAPRRTTSWPATE